METEIKEGDVFTYLGKIFIAKKVHHKDVLPTKSWGAAMSWFPLRDCIKVEGEKYF